jgi:hypothetical protein
MTLILTVLGEELVVIAADRMLSRASSGTPNVDNAIKMVIFYNDMAFGYTGLAQLINEKRKWVDTDRWLVNVLMEVRIRSARDACALIAQRANEAFASIQQRTGKSWPHAFLGGGWVRNPNVADIKPEPSAILISNFHNIVQSANPAPLVIETAPSTSFRVIPVSLMSGMGGIFRVGFPQNEQETSWLLQTLAKCRSDRDICIALKESIRQTSRRLNGRYVGEDVLTGVMPRRASIAACVRVVGPQGGNGAIFANEEVMTAGAKLANDESSCFLRFAPRRDNGVYAAPHIVAPGFDHSAFLFPEHGEMECMVEFISSRIGQFDAVVHSRVKRPRLKKRNS